MKKVSTYILIGVELVGCWLLYQHRYMGFREDIFAIMCVFGIAYFICEVARDIISMNCKTDIITNIDDNYDFTEEDWEEIKQIKKEIEDKMNE